MLTKHSPLPPFPQSLKHLVYNAQSFNIVKYQT